MVRRVVLFALARAASEGDADAAYEALAGLDPLVRPLARRRLRAVLASAATMTSVDDPAHRSRLAFLVAARGLPSADYDDVTAIAAEQAAAAADVPAPPRRGPFVTLSLAAVVVLAAAALIARAIVLRPFDPRRTEAGAVLSVAMTDFVVAADRGPGRDEAAVARALEAATGARAKKAFGDDGTRLLRTLLETTGKLALEDPAGPVAERAEPFFGAATSFDRFLDERRLPYFVDTELIADGRGVLPLLVAFYVEREERVEAAGTSVRAVHLVRIDSLNLRQGYLGYTRPRTPAALVLLDQIESDLVRYVLPALPAGERMAIVDEDTERRAEPWVEPFEDRAAAVVRRYYDDAKVPGLERVGKLLARRRALVEKWRAGIAGLGLALRVPERLVPEADYASDLAKRVPRSELGEWDDLHDALLRPDVLGAFVAARDRYAASVQRHEVQHRLDYARDLVPVPEPLRANLGLASALDAPEGSLAARSRDELSAYLAELARPDDSPALDLLLLARFVLDGNAGVDAYWYTSVTAFQGIARELGLDPDALLGRGAVRRERFAKLVLAVLDRRPDELRAAAGSFYRSAYGVPVPDVTTKGGVQNAAFRH